MSHARIRAAGQETWHHNVTKIVAHGDYISLHLDAHPSVVHYWLGKQSMSYMMLCADDAEVTRALQEERGQLS